MSDQPAVPVNDTTEEQPKLLNAAEAAELQQNEPDGDPAGAAELVLPGAMITLRGVNARVAEAGEGDDKERVLLIGPFVLQIALPFSEAGAHNVARELAGGGLHIATSLSPQDKAAADLIIQR